MFKNSMISLYFKLNGGVEMLVETIGRNICYSINQITGRYTFWRYSLHGLDCIDTNLTRDQALFKLALMEDI